MAPHKSSQRSFAPEFDRAQNQRVLMAAGRRRSFVRASEGTKNLPDLESELRQIILNNYLGHFSESIALCKHLLAAADEPLHHRWRAPLEPAVAQMPLGTVPD